MTDSSTTLIKEGTTELFVYTNKTSTKGPSIRERTPFYNSSMELNRDVSILVNQWFLNTQQKHVHLLDGLAASGVRGIRLAHELSGDFEVTLNDWDDQSVALIQQNIQKNKVKNASVFQRDLGCLLLERRYHSIDIDPFGSPVDFVNAAVQNVRNGGTVAITATDTAPLYGTYPRTSLRRYGALSQRSPFAHETGVRILAGFMVREAARHDRACEPLLCYHADHYFRCYFRVVNGAARADAAVKRLGFAHFDKASLDRGVLAERADKADAGPLWTGPLLSKDLLAGMKVTKDLGTSPRCEKYLALWTEEAQAPPLFYKLDELAKRTKHSPPKLNAMVEALAEGGHRASRSHFDPKGLKTDASVEELLHIFKDT